jgi:hypothetical protein
VSAGGGRAVALVERIADCRKDRLSAALGAQALAERHAGVFLARLVQRAERADPDRPDPEHRGEAARAKPSRGATGYSAASGGRSTTEHANRAGHAGDWQLDERRAGEADGGGQPLERKRKPGDGCGERRDQRDGRGKRNANSVSEALPWNT